MNKRAYRSIVLPSKKLIFMGSKVIVLFFNMIGLALLC